MRLLYFILLILCAGLIFYISGIPHFSTGSQGFLSRKIGHSLVYGIFTVLLWKSIPWFENNLLKKSLLCAFIVLAYAISDEIHQSFVPGRHGNIKGVLFDLIGAMAVLSWFYRKKVLG
ncbi:MAG: VanZ family protein [Desulfobacterales bacterium]|nr:VanZ family protein [Desulfobacterales bacterium]